MASSGTSYCASHGHECTGHAEEIETREQIEDRETREQIEDREDGQPVNYQQYEEPIGWRHASHLQSPEPASKHYRYKILLVGM